MSPAPVSKSIGFVPIISREDLESDDINRLNSSDPDTQLNGNAVEYASPQKKTDLSD